ncbi:translocation/assembly module TamB domain-containing protein [Stappia sp. ES.058]|uniref:translocation/assembly module TamB domain-containing protein n=1 Tax=Stappia sp. ES.058 TaxID=1881061 RepID=UPI00087D90D6|nr:translocation/assembly module TamB domain-containing protein [Stappia sp. ES.058]SDU02192.1 translocation and assembly module TamB [Stappia sp. ES.058]
MTASLPIRLGVSLIRITLRVVLGLAILLAFLAIGTLAVLQTDAGRRNAAGLIGWIASNENGGIALDGLSVDWDLDLRLASLVVRDVDGPYLSVSGLDLAWRPSALLSGVVAVDQLLVERVALARLPASPATADPEPATEAGLPALPAVVLEAASIETIDLGAAVAGTPMRLAATAELRTEAAPQSLSGKVSITRTDDTDGEVDAQLRFDRDAGVLAVSVAAREPRGGLAARLLQIDGLPALDLSIKGEGPLNDWRAELALKLDGETDVSGTARLSRSTSSSGTAQRTLEASISGRLTPLAPPLAGAFLMGETRITATALMSDDFTPQNVELSAASDTLSSDVAATFDLQSSTLDATANLRLSAGGDALIALELPERRVTLGETTVSAMAKGPLSELSWTVDLASASLDTTEVALDSARVVLDGEDLDATNPSAAIAATVSATIERLSPKADGAAEFAGPLQADAKLTLDPTTLATEIGSFDADFAPFTLSARGTVSPDTVNTDLTLNVSDTARLDPQLSGALSVEAHVEGPLSGPMITADANAERLTLAGKPVRNLRLSARADTNPEALSADIDLDADVDGNALTATLRATPEGDGLSVPTLTIRAGDNTLSGTLLIADLTRTTQTLTGNLTIDAPDLSEFSALALTELSGQLSGDVAVTQDDGSAAAHVQLTGADISAAGTSLGTLDADVRLRDLFTAPALDGKARVTGVVAGGTPIDRVTATASGTGSSTDFTLDARLAKGENADGLALDGTLATGDGGMNLLLKTLDGRYRGLETRLVDPARIVSSQSGTRIEPFSLRLGDGTITVAGNVGDALDATADIKAVPLSLANALAPGFAIAGTLDGKVTVSGQTSDPIADWRLNAGSLAAAPLRENGLPALSVASTGRFSGNRLTQTTRITGPNDLSVVAEGPVSLDGAGSLDIGVNGTLPLAVARQKLILAGFSADGSLSVSGRIGGSFSSPTYALTLQPKNVSTTQLATGLSLRNLSGTIEINNSGIALNTLRADIAGGGSLSASGRVGLDAGMPADLRVQVQNGRYSDGRIVQATVSADITLTGPLASTQTAARLGGSVTIERADITIPSSLPGAIDPVAVTHKNAPAAVRAQDRALHGEGGGGGGEAGARPIALDIMINAPGQIFVRGRGLDAEMGGSLKLAGTVAAPQAIGSFSMRRGHFNVLSRRVEFSKGEVGFTGSLTPRLDFAATSQTSDAVITITVKGQADAPEIGFSSSPDLPQDEILAQFLFDRSMSELSPTQIAQLGASVLTLTGGSGAGPLGSLRQSLGLDAIDVQTGGEGGPSLAVGKYLSDNIYLGVKQGSGADSSRVTVDIDITKSLKLRGEVGADGESKAGIFFEREFGK